MISILSFTNYSVETLLRWGGKRFHSFIANLFRKLCTQISWESPEFYKRWYKIRFGLLISRCIRWYVVIFSEVTENKMRHDRRFALNSENLNCARLRCHVSNSWVLEHIVFEQINTWMNVRTLVVCRYGRGRALRYKCHCNSYLYPDDIPRLTTVSSHLMYGEQGSSEAFVRWRWRHRP